MISSPQRSQLIISSAFSVDVFLVSPKASTPTLPALSLIRKKNYKVGASGQFNVARPHGEPRVKYCTPLEQVQVLAGQHREVGHGRGTAHREPGRLLTDHGFEYLPRGSPVAEGAVLGNLLEVPQKGLPGGLVEAVVMPRAKRLDNGHQFSRAVVGELDRAAEPRLHAGVG